MKFKGLLAAGLLAAAAAVGVAAAQQPEAAVTASDIIEMRQRVMMGNDQASRLIVGMLKNQIPFDASLVSNLLLTIAHDNAIFPSLMLGGTDTGKGTYTQRDTEVAPAAWADLTGFVTLSAKMSTDAQAAAAVAGGDRLALALAYKAVSDNCSACHEKYRVEKEN